MVVAVQADLQAGRRRTEERSKKPRSAADRRHHAARLEYTCRTGYDVPIRSTIMWTRWTGPPTVETPGDRDHFKFRDATTSKLLNMCMLYYTVYKKWSLIKVK